MPSTQLRIIIRGDDAGTKKIAILEMIDSLLAEKNQKEAENIGWEKVASVEVVESLLLPQKSIVLRLKASVSLSTIVGHDTTNLERGLLMDLKDRLSGLGEIDLIVTNKDPLKIEYGL